MGGTAVFSAEGLGGREIRGSAVRHQTRGDGRLSGDAEAGNIAGEIGTDLSDAPEDTRVGCLSTHERGNGGNSRQNEELHDFRRRDARKVWNE
jgi:hypothetical protein